MGCTDQYSNHNNLSFDTATEKWRATWGFEKSLSVPTKKVILERMKADGLDPTTYEFVKAKPRRWTAAPRDKVGT